MEKMKLGATFLSAEKTNKYLEDKIYSAIISEEEMLGVNEFIGGEYPHCYFR